jgi:CDP-diacylglycerol pyrophosphatase
MAAGAAAWLHGRDTLWRIVHSDCVPAAQAGTPSPCASVTLGGVGSSVVLKDRVGPLQYLLLPTTRIAGIEDPAVLEPPAIVYWRDAWRARGWMEKTYGAPIPRDAIAITVNSAWSRSQDQLHFHISCIRPDLQAHLRKLKGMGTDQWADMPGGWRNHPYRIRRLDAPTLDGLNVFAEVAKLTHDQMSRQAIAVVGAEFEGRPGFWLLATHVDLLKAWPAGIEGDVQDHSCAALR